MGVFEVRESFYLGTHDLLVLTGRIVEDPVRPGMTLFLPRTEAGEGRVPIAGLQVVEFATGPQLALTITMEAFDRVPGLDFADLHGQTLQVR